MITKEDWVDWKKNPVTLVFLKRIKEKREALKEGLAEGAADQMEIYRTIGRCMSLADVLEEALYNFLEEGEELDH